jgi:hypothetical protein
MLAFDVLVEGNYKTMLYNECCPSETTPRNELEIQRKEEKNLAADQPPMWAPDTCDAA